MSTALQFHPLAFSVKIGFGQDAGWQFNWLKFGLSFGLKNGLRFHFDSVTCLNMSQAKTQSIFFTTFCPIELERELQY